MENSKVVEFLNERIKNIQLNIDTPYMSTEWYVEWRFRLKECEQMVDYLTNYPL